MRSKEQKNYVKTEAYRLQKKAFKPNDSIFWLCKIRRAETKNSYVIK